MRAAYVERFDPANPAAALTVGERPEPEPRPGWVPVTVRAASLNHHDVFALRGGVLPEDALPRIMGMDAAGVDPDGNPVVVHNLINSPGWAGDPLLDPGITGLSEGYDGTFADTVLAPKQNLVPKPEALSFEEAACLPTAWLTAYRMLFVEADARPGDRVLVQGAAGGVASALIAMGSAAGVRMWATGRTARSRRHAESLGAEIVVEPGERLPERVDAVMETVGAATWKHSLRCLRKGGIVVVAGATSGPIGETELVRIFMRNIRIAGSTMGTIEELDRMIAFLSSAGIKPGVGTVLPLDQAPDGVNLMAEGGVRGKVVIQP